ncbi:sulfotransferase 1A1-like [Clavelina lepadiformis]|uniref:sulfotransferase 1A1-like n=1 Tax=Clavelina lepadiformis TaxID=159417 RepID=UPI0040411274
MMEMTKLISPVQAYLESGTPMNYQIMQKLPWRRKIWGTHVPASLLDMKRLKKNGCKIINVMRNPKDQLVSWFNMFNNLPFHKMEPISHYYPDEWNSFFESFVNGQQPQFSKKGEWYPEYILSWYPYRTEDNVLFVMYENIKKNPAKEIRKIADHLGVERSDEEIDQIVEATSFSSMKKGASARHVKMKFFRKGEIGDWKNRFTVAQSELMDQKFNEKLSDLDIEFKYQ